MDDKKHYINNHSMEKNQKVESSLTAIVQAMYPGFSRGSILAQSKINKPTYQGMAPRKKPIINLQ